MSDALTELTNVTIVAEVEDVRAALRAIAFERVDVVVTDFELPDGDALDILEAAGRVDPKPAVVVYPAESFPERHRRSLAAGAAVYLPREAPREHLQDAVLSTATGRRAARGSPWPGEPVDLAALVPRVLGRLGRIVANASVVPFAIEPELPAVRGVVPELERLVLDLVLDAIGDHTRFELQLRRQSSTTVRLEVVTVDGVRLGGADLPIWC